LNSVKRYSLRKIVRTELSFEIHGTLSTRASSDAWLGEQERSETENCT